jgi:hypothetical protein
MALTILLSGAAASALGQSVQMPGTAGSTGPIQNPGAILTDGGWQPLFEGTRDPDADLIFEVPVTLESIPRAIRIGGTGPLITPDQLIVTCIAFPEFDRLGPSSLGGIAWDLPEQGSASDSAETAEADDSGTFSRGSTYAPDLSSQDLSTDPTSYLDFMRMLSSTTSIPLERIQPGVERVVAVSVTPDERLPFGVDNWICGMALWAESEADACPIGTCALPSMDGLNETPGPSYEPQPSAGSLMVTEGSVPAIP